MELPASRMLARLRGMRDGVRLGIDYGSASAAAVVSLPHTAAIPIPVEPAGVFVEPTTGALITGQAGAAAAVERPDCYVTPVHHLAEEAVTVANQQIPVVDLLAAALASLATTAAATAGASITSIGIAIPAGWGPTRRALIQQGADRAGLPVPELVAAPAAVASHLATVTGAPPPEGACVLVCDAGASGLHLTALEQQGGGHLGVLATASIADVGGDAIDAALTGHATTASATGTTTAPQPSSDVHINNARERYALLAAARHAKHQLASTWRAAIPLPDGGVGVIDRDQLATLTKPALDHLGRHIGHRPHPPRSGHPHRQRQRAAWARRLDRRRHRPPTHHTAAPRACRRVRCRPRRQPPHIAIRRAPQPAPTVGCSPGSPRRRDAAANLGRLRRAAGHGLRASGPR